MPVSGLVITFEGEVSEYSETVAALASQRQIDLGARQHAKLALVLDTASSEEDKQVWEWVQNLPGVQDVALAFVAFDDSEVPDSEVPDSQVPDSQEHEAQDAPNNHGRAKERSGCATE